MSELHFLTIAQGAALIARRAISPVEWTRALLDRIAALDGQLNAFLQVTGELAIARARDAEREITAGRLRGPLHGVPFALKDLFDTAGIPTTAQSRIAIDRVPTVDAEVTSRLHEAGAVLVGKLAMHEFAHGGPSLDIPWPPARNPWNPMHFAGSSSSGSAVAVAAGFVPATMGTDTGGSIRIPAGLCGIAGLKPTYGLVSRRGVIPCAPSLDHCGPMAWTSEDCALLLQATAGHDSADPSSSRAPVADYPAQLNRGLRGLRIGVVRHFWESDLPMPDDAVAATEAALDVLRQLGAKLDDVTLRPLQDYSDVRIILQEPEVFALHHSDLATRPGDYGRDFLGRALFACALGSHVYVQAGRERRKMVCQMAASLNDRDALVTIGPGPAPRFDAERTFGFIFGLWGKPNLTSPFSVTGFPALNVCSGYSASGLPLSIQIVGRPFEDGLVLRVGHAYEHATTWRSRRPQFVQGASHPAIELALDAPSQPLNARTKTFIDCSVEQAGLNLSDEQMQLLYQAAPYALAMAKRICNSHDWAHEQANNFRLDHPAIESE